MPKRWHIRPHDRAAVARLEREAGVPSIVAALLVARGVTDPAEVKAFLDGTLADLRDPEALPGVPEAADRILAAVVRALDNGARTRDLGGSLTTAQMGDAVLAAL